MQTKIVYLQTSNRLLITRKTMASAIKNHHHQQHIIEPKNLTHQNNYASALVFASWRQALRCSISDSILLTFFLSAFASLACDVNIAISSFVTSALSWIFMYFVCILLPVVTSFASSPRTCCRGEKIGLSAKDFESIPAKRRHTHFYTCATMEREHTQTEASTMYLFNRFELRW